MLFANQANPGFLLDVMAGGPTDRAEAGVTQFTADQWWRWRQLPRTTFGHIRTNETGWPAVESGQPNMAPFGLVEEVPIQGDDDMVGSQDACAHCNDAVLPQACTAACLEDMWRLDADAEALSRAETAKVVGMAAGAAVLAGIAFMALR